MKRSLHHWDHFIRLLL